MNKRTRRRRALLAKKAKRVGAMIVPYDEWALWRLVHLENIMEFKGRHSARFTRGLLAHGQKRGSMCDGDPEAMPNKPLPKVL